MATIKLILTRDVANLSNASEVAEAKSDCIHNYLVPRGFAVKWTKGTQKQIDRIIAARRRHEIEPIDDTRELRDTLQAAAPIIISGKIGTSSRLFGAISDTQIAEAVKTQLDKVINRRRVVIASPAKSTGDHTTVVNLHPEVTAELRVRVIAE